MLRDERHPILGKIAAQLDQAVSARLRDGRPGDAHTTTLARGDGWRVSDVVCTSGPGDRVFEEQHVGMSVALVVSGTFEYRSARDPQLMSAGSMLLGNSGQCFECGHTHATGDRCIAFHYDDDRLVRIAAEVGIGREARRFSSPRIPPNKRSTGLFARAAAMLGGSTTLSWEELSLDVAATALQLSTHAPISRRVPPQALRRVTESIRQIERKSSEQMKLSSLATEAGLSEFHYLRAFRQVTGVTPHQFLLRARLREAGARLLAGDDRVIDVALDSGFGDLSNFNHAFRAEVGATPTQFRGPTWG